MQVIFVPVYMIVAMKINKYSLIIGVVTTVLLSCNSRTGDIPFPSGQWGVREPVTQVLQFSGEKKLLMTTVRKGSIKPEKRHFDLDAIPVKSYDSARITTFSQPPAVSNFKWNALPDTAIDFSKLPSKPLHFKTFILATPVITQAGKLTQKSGTVYPVLDFGNDPDFAGKFVTGLVTDKRGFIWIANAKGLYRYDGTYLSRFVDVDPSESFITGLVVDEKNRAWFTKDGKLFMLDPQTLTIKQSTTISIPPNYFSNIFIDSRGWIWIGNSTDSLQKIVDPLSESFRQLPKDIPVAYSTVEDDKHNIWMTTLNGIKIVNPETGHIKTLKHEHGLANGSAAILTKGDKGSIWAFIVNQGLDEIAPSAGTIYHYGRLQGVKINYAAFLLRDAGGRIWSADSNYNLFALDTRGSTTTFPLKAGLISRYLITMMCDEKSRLWIGASSGLTVVKNTAVSRLFDKESVSTQAEDANGNIWIGTNTALHVLNPRSKQIRTITTSDGLGNEQAQSISVFDGNIWITTNGGFDIIDIKKQTLEHLGRKDGLSSDTIFNIIKDSHYNIWFTTQSAGIDLIDSQKTFIRHAGIKEGLSDEGITDVKEDGHGLIWLATLNQGIDVIDPIKGTVRYLSGKPGLQGRYNRVLMEESPGRIWIGTDHGIYIADANNNTLTHITRENGLTGDKINAMLRYGDMVVVSTENAPCIVYLNTNAHPRKLTVAALNGSDGLIKVSSTFSSNLITKKGQLYWGDNGLTIIDTLQADTARYDTYITGLQIMDQPIHFSSQPSLTNKDTLWTADSFYVNGIIPVQPAAQKLGLNWGDTVSGPYNTPAQLTLPYFANYMQFHFGEANTGRQDSVIYAYVLQGIDKDWHMTDKPNSENYLNLAAGHYRFDVRSKQPGGTWGNTASFSFNITPPWWKTWWAYTLLVLVTIAAIGLFIRNRSKRLIKENLLLEEKIKQRTEDLQKSLQELKATQAQLIQSEKMASLGELTAGIAHEIQNPLNFVNNFAEVSVELAEELKAEMQECVLPERKQAAMHELLSDLVDNQQKINYHGKRADSIVKGMLQHSRIGSGQKEPTDINTLADEFLRLSYHGLRARDKTFNARLETDFDVTLPKINILAQDVGRVLLNMFTNAFYSTMQKKKKLGTAYEPLVSVTTTHNADSLEIKVRDNGIGIPQPVLDKIYNPFFTTKPTGEGTGLGLSLSYDIITKAHRGYIKVNTQEGAFAEFIVTIPFAQTELKQ